MMDPNHNDLGAILVRLMALATRLEGEGQYNLAKLARAAADSLAFQAAYQIDLPSDPGQLSASVYKAVGDLSTHGMASELLEALQHGTHAMAEERLPMIAETPHAYVCRTCGHLALGAAPERCPTCAAWAATFKQFLPMYWLTALDPFQALESLRKTPLEVEKMVTAVAEETLNRVPISGGWSAHNILAHLLDSQGVLDQRVNLLLDQQDPIISSQAVFAWATGEGERPSTTQGILQTYRQSRQKTLARLEKIPFQDWWRSGQHEEFGPVTLLQQASYFAMHEITHLPRLEQLSNA